MVIPLKAKYRFPNHRVRRGDEDSRFTDVTRYFVIGVSSSRSKKGGNSGGVGRVVRRRTRWPEGIKGRRKAA